MKTITRIRNRHTAKAGRLGLVSLVVAALAGGAGIAPVQADAAPNQIKRPQLRDGVLSIEGSKRSDRLALRLQAGNPGVLELDVGDDGYADFAIARDRIGQIDLDAEQGDDLVRIDESNGAVSDIPLTIDGGAKETTTAGGSGAELLLGGDGNDSIDGNRGNDVAFMGAGDDTFVYECSRLGSDVVEGQDGADTMLFNGAGGPRSRSICRPAETAFASSALRPPSPWTRAVSSGSTSTPSAALTSSR